MKTSGLGLVLGALIVGGSAGSSRTAAAGETPIASPAPVAQARAASTVEPPVRSPVIARATSLDGSRRIVATAAGTVWRWSAETASWCELGAVCADRRPSTSPGASRVTDLRFSPVDSSTVFLAASDAGAPSRAGVYVSDDFGGTWHRVTRLHCDGATSAVEALGFGGGDRDAGKVVWAIGDCEVARSDDGGVTWAHRALAVADGAFSDAPREVRERVARAARHERDATDLRFVQ